jgi:hypothetical protein
MMAIVHRQDMGVLIKKMVRFSFLQKNLLAVFAKKLIFVLALQSGVIQNSYPHRLSSYENLAAILYHPKAQLHSTSALQDPASIHEERRHRKSHRKVL